MGNFGAFLRRVILEGLSWDVLKWLLVAGGGVMIALLTGVGAFLRSVPDQYVLPILVGGYLLAMLVVVFAIKGLQLFPRRIETGEDEEAFSIRRMDELIRESARIRSVLDHVPKGTPATDDHFFEVRCWAQESARVMTNDSVALNDIRALPLEHEQNNPDALKGYLYRASGWITKHRNQLHGTLKPKQRRA